MSTYNSGAPVLEAVDSMLAQTYRNIEVIVVDDGSKDGTPELLRERYGDRIRLIAQPNGGIANARNACMEAARGEYIAWFDHDDICEPQRVEWQVAFMQQRPQMLLCCTDFSAFRNDGWKSASHAAEYYGAIRFAPGGLSDLLDETSSVVLPRAGMSDLGGELADGGVRFKAYYGQVFKTLALGNFIHPPTIMMRRSLWDRGDRFDPSIRIQCDFDWLLRACREGEFGYLDAPLLQYRLSATQASNWRNNVQSALDIVEVVERVKAMDPVFFEANIKALRKRQGSWRCDAAYTLSEIDRLKARDLLWRSLANGFVSKLSLLTAAKVLLPMPVVKRLKSVPA
jgi:glycosyltransferase involved in cell wall biosynthesis